MPSRADTDIGSGVLSDDQIASLNADQRHELAGRLLGLTPLVVHHSAAGRRRHRLLILLITCCVGLIPWIVVLGVSLPRHYVAANWEATWIVFDAVLLVSLALTAYLGWRRRHLVVLSSFATGVLLVCDAWFDVSTASGRDLIIAIGSAALIELPLAAVLFRVSFSLLRLVMARRIGGGGLAALWRLPVLVEQDTVPGERLS